MSNSDTFPSNAVQRGLLQEIPEAGLYLFFHLKSAPHALTALRDLQVDGEQLVIGLGKSLTDALGVSAPGLRTFAALSNAQLHIPSTPFALVCWLRGADREALEARSKTLLTQTSDAFVLAHSVPTFAYRPPGSVRGHDLTGYEDGTENPDELRAPGIAFCPDGSSLMAVQQWVHDLAAFTLFDKQTQDLTIGRVRETNEELDEAPESAHVKRTAQESFDPQAWMLRRSMPFDNAQGKGLMFVAFARSLDAFEAQMRRMTGLEDGITDALFSFSKPLTGAYFWCPPLNHPLLR
jgi:putative iron-dependent peroxidase